jgi:hypothetical protein
VNWYEFWLFLHIMAAIVAFGPIFVFPLVGILRAKNPQHVLFAVHIDESIESRLVIPFALTMPVSGAALIIDRHIDLTSSKWLGVAIILYAIALALALFHQVPATRRLIRIAEAMPAQGPGAEAAGPPPEMVAIFNRVRAVGMLLTLLLVTIVVMMIFKPGGTTFTT